MPNHCANRLTIYGTREQFLQFMIKFHTAPNTYLNFEPFKHQILEIHRTASRLHVEEGDLQTPVPACYKYWSPARTCGTKIFVFYTACGPISSASIIFMSHQFPALKFVLHYAEQNFGLFGEVVAHNGQITKDWRVLDAVEGGYVTVDEETGLTLKTDTFPVEYYELWDISG